MSIEATQRPLVACGIIVLRNGKILLGERLSSHGAGTFQIPGGHLEYGKTFAEQAAIEVQEETGLTEIIFKGVISLNNEIVYGKHYVSLGLLAESTQGEPHTGEPGKSRNWQWYDPEQLPHPLFAPSEGVIAAWKSGVFLNEIRS